MEELKKVQVKGVEVVLYPGCMGKERGGGGRCFGATLRSVEEDLRGHGWCEEILAWFCLALSG